MESYLKTNLTGFPLGFSAECFVMVLRLAVLVEKRLSKRSCGARDRIQLGGETGADDI